MLKKQSKKLWLFKYLIIIEGVFNWVDFKAAGCWKLEKFTGAVFVWRWSKHHTVTSGDRTRCTFFLYEVRGLWWCSIFLTWRLNLGIWKSRIMQQKKTQGDSSSRNTLSLPGSEAAASTGRIKTRAIYFLLMLDQECTLEPRANIVVALCCMQSWRCCKPKSARRNRERGCLSRINPLGLSGWWLY